MDLDLSRGVTSASLADLPVPALVIAGGVPTEDMSPELESADRLTRMPETNTQHVKIGDATHFSFMSICKPGGMALIEESSPGDGMICRDDERALPRAVIQQQVVEVISRFLAKSFQH